MEGQTMAIHAFTQARPTEFHQEREKRQRVYGFIAAQKSPISLREIIQGIETSDDAELKSLGSMELRMLLLDLIDKRLVDFSQEMEISTIKKNGKK
jgi:hypothetical protein